MMVIIRDIKIKPKKISIKKFVLIFKLVSLPYPDIENESKIIPRINISI